MRKTGYELFVMVGGMVGCSYLVPYFPVTARGCQSHIRTSFHVLNVEREDEDQNGRSKQDARCSKSRSTTPMKHFNHFPDPLG